MAEAARAELAQIEDELKKRKAAEELAGIEDELKARLGEKYSTLDAVRTGVESGVTLGFRDELGGVAGAIGKGASGFMADLPEDRGFLDKFKRGAEFAKQGYVEGRDSSRQEVEDIKKVHPKAFGVAEFASGMALPLGGLTKGAKTVGQIAKQGAGLGAIYGFGSAEGDVGEQALQTATGAGIGALAGPLAEKVVVPAIAGGAKYVGNKAAKLASGVFGVSSDDITTFATKSAEVGEMAAESPGGVAHAAAKVSDKIKRQVALGKQKLNQEISGVLNEEAGQVPVSLDDVVDTLMQKRASLDPEIQTAKVAEVDRLYNEMLGKFYQGGQSGELTAQRANLLKRELQEVASSGKAYDSAQKGFFDVSPEYAQAARDAAAVLRQKVELALPEESRKTVRLANSKLSALHGIERNINKNALNPDKALNPLLTAGRNSQGKEARLLQGLDKTVGSTALEEAQKLSAMESFVTNVPLIPQGTTGATLTRAAVGGTLGYLAGGGDSSMSTGVGLALTSPYVLKGAIQAGRAIAPAIRNINRQFFTPMILNYLADRPVEQDERGRGYYSLMEAEKPLFEKHIQEADDVDSVAQAKALDSVRRRSRIFVDEPVPEKEQAQESKRKPDVPVSNDIEDIVKSRRRDEF